MIKNIFWDFDGVILDSMKIKGDGFVELFSSYDKELIDKLEKYHYKNGGVSRFDKIYYFYNDILKKEISKDDVYKEADKFAYIIEKKLYNKSNLISDSINFIKANHKRYNFHIVSGAEHQELNTLCRFFEIDNYFKTIDGSPTKKDILVDNIMKNYKYKKEESILIGDAFTDYIAATSNGIEFFGYNNPELKKYKYIDNFREFRL